MSVLLRLSLVTLILLIIFNYSYGNNLNLYNQYNIQVEGGLEYSKDINQERYSKGQQNGSLYRKNLVTLNYNLLQNRTVEISFLADFTDRISQTVGGGGEGQFRFNKRSKLLFSYYYEDERYDSEKYYNVHEWSLGYNYENIYGYGEMNFNRSYLNYFNFYDYQDYYLELSFTLKYDSQLFAPSYQIGHGNVEDSKEYFISLANNFDLSDNLSSLITVEYYLRQNIWDEYAYNSTLIYLEGEYIIPFVKSLSTNIELSQEFTKYRSGVYVNAFTIASSVSYSLRL